MPGIQELIVIAVVALLVFGPDRLPELARNAGRWLGRLRAATQRNVDELNRMSEIQQLQAELRELRREFDQARPALASRASGGTVGQRRAGATGSPRRGGTPGSGPRAFGTGSTAAAAAVGLVTRPDDQPAPADPDAT